MSIATKVVTTQMAFVKLGVKKENMYKNLINSRNLGLRCLRTLGVLLHSVGEIVLGYTTLILGSHAIEAKLKAKLKSLNAMANFSYEAKEKRG